MKNLAILHLINSFGNSSITRIVRDLVYHLGCQDFTWHVGGLSEADDMRDEIENLGATVMHFARPGTRSMETARRIRKYCIEHRIDIVHTHTPRTILMYLFALGGRRRPLHVATKHILNAPGDRRWGMLYALADRLLLSFPDHLVAVSQNLANEILAFPRLRKNGLSMIRNAIDCDSYFAPDQKSPCRQEFSLAPEAPVIGSTGRLEKVKRFDLLLQGFSSVLLRYPNARLIIVGDGSLRGELEILAKSLGISHAVIWTGFRKDIARLLAAMDIYVQSSVNEGLSLSVLEAMAAVKPVIITDVGGAKEIVSDGINGIIIAPDSASAISTTVINLLENPEKSSKLAQAGRDYILREFSLQRMVKSYKELYEQLLGFKALREGF